MTHAYLPPFHRLPLIQVSRSDVDAALALMTSSQASITPDIERRVRDDPISRVYQAVRTHALRTRQAEVSLDTIRQLVAFDREINKVRPRRPAPPTRSPLQEGACHHRTHL